MGSGLKNLWGTPQLLMMAKGEKGTKDPSPLSAFSPYFLKGKALRDVGGKACRSYLNKAQHLRSRLVPSGLRSKRFHAVSEQNRGTRVKDREKNGASRRAGRGRDWLSFHFTRGQKRKSRSWVFQRKRSVRRLCTQSLFILL